MGKYGILAAAMATAVSGLGYAQSEDDDATYISIMGTYSQYDDDRNAYAPAATAGASTTNIDNGGGVQFVFGQQKAEGFGVEFTLFADFLETDSGNGTDFYRQGVGLDLLYGFGNRQGFTPYILLGAGAAYNDVFPDAGDDYDAYANAGLGFVTPPLNKYGMKLRLEARYIYDAFQTAYGDYKAGVGLEFPLFGKPKMIEKVVEQVKVVEIEGEGGLSDSDNDGIVDGRDNCPDTPEGTRVDGSGCPLGDVVALNGVTFELNSDRLRPDARTILDAVAEILNRYPQMQVEVAGHTDSIGSDAYNLQLSQKRAQAVVNYLSGKGVDTTRMSAKGYGESEPVDSNETRDGRERNRRVELRIQN